MLKKLVAGALLTVSSLTGGLGSVSASTEKDYSISSFEYVTVDEKTVDSFNKLGAPSKEDVKITVVLPKQNQNGDWLSYGFSNKESLDSFIEKDKQRLNNTINPLVLEEHLIVQISMNMQIKVASIFLLVAVLKFASNWQNRISSVSTASLLLAIRQHYGIVLQLKDMVKVSSSNTLIGMVKL